jgi:hypothetical protein
MWSAAKTLPGADRAVIRSSSRSAAAGGRA